MRRLFSVGYRNLARARLMFSTPIGRVCVVAAAANRSVKLSKNLRTAERIWRGITHFVSERMLARRIKPPWCASTAETGHRPKPRA
jgi:hypothetical protein